MEKAVQVFRCTEKKVSALLFSTLFYSNFVFMFHFVKLIAAKLRQLV